MSISPDTVKLGTTARSIQGGVQFQVDFLSPELSAMNDAQRRAMAFRLLDILQGNIPAILEGM